MVPWTNTGHMCYVASMGRVHEVLSGKFHSYFSNPLNLDYGSKFVFAIAGFNHNNYRKAIQPPSPSTSSCSVY